MDFEVNKRGEVLKVEKQLAADGETVQVVIKTHYTWFSGLKITGTSSLVVNIPGTFTVSYKDWQNNPLSDETRPIKVKITGPGQPAELTLTPANGQAEFDFESPIAGTFTITATADFPCDPGILEVTVHE